MSKYINFHSDSETDVLSYKNRTDNLYNYRKNIKELIDRNGFRTTSDLDKFFKLKASDADSSDVILPDSDDALTSDESKIINNAIENQAAAEFVQLFLDKYMAPMNSDIQYRLGKVTGIKEYLYNKKHEVTINDPFVYGQYDKYGRIDTTINLRYAVNISGIQGYKLNTWYSNLEKKTSVSNSLGYIIPPYTENYVNFFFPPYRTDAFADDTSLAHVADTYIKTRTWDNQRKKWIYKDNVDLDNLTYDTGKLLSMRKHPTYRNPAFKAINDNISMLQYFMEQTTGIVSTYLTEWDISIYIQEGLLSENYGQTPSYLTLTNRILKDNPSRFRNSNAFTYGVLNAAVSKTPIGVPTPNTSVWNPSAYPLSTYWTQYDSVNRGDGLDKFYDIALQGFPKNKFKSYSFKEKIVWGDQLGAAYSGWYNWDNMYYWQALYTNKGDGLEHVDIVHMNEDASCDVFENTLDDDNEQVDGIIQKIIDALYNSDGNLEMAPNVDEEWTEDSNFKDSKGHLITRSNHCRYSKNPPYETETFKITYYDNDDNKYIDYEPEVDEDGNATGDYKAVEADDSTMDVDINETDYKILGITIKGSRILKIFLNKDSITDKVMKLANKESGTSYSSASSTSSKSTGNSVNSNYNKSTSSTSKSPSQSSSTTSNNIEDNSSSSTNYYSDINNGSDTGSGSDSPSKSTVLSMVDTDESISGQYSRPSGVSQLAPPLYGGPHGKYYSPKTIQGYFEENNEFFRNIPRIDWNAKSPNPTRNFTGLERNYSPTNNYRKNSPFRSPSSCLTLLDEGWCDYTQQLVQSMIKHYVWQETSTGFYNGWAYKAISSKLVPQEYNTGFLTPDNQIVTDSSNHDAYGTNKVEWDNYYQYYKSTYTFHKDYWGKLNCYKRVTYSNYVFGYSGTTTTAPYAPNWGKSWYTAYKNMQKYGYWSVYLLKGTYYKRMYYCEYKSWDNFYYKRPLMHSNPNASNDSYWQITQCCYGATVYCQKSGNTWWKNFMNKRFGDLLSNNLIRYSPSAKDYYISIATKNDENRWRLTFPKSSVLFKNKSIHNDGLYELRTNEENNFMTYVTGNSKDEGNTNGSEWHDVIFFQSNDSNINTRIKKGPIMMFKVPVRKQTYDFEYYETVKHTKFINYDSTKTVKNVYRIFWKVYTTITKIPWKYSKWVEYETQEVRVGKAAWIEVDMKNVKEVWSGIQNEPWSNLDITRYNSDKQETYNDVPTASRTELPDTPFSYMLETSVLPTWGTKTVTDKKKPYIFGWGYCTTLPGMNFTRVDQTRFEDPRNYLNLVKYYNNKTNNKISAKNVRYNDLKFPFYSLNNTLELIYITNPSSSKSLKVQGIKRYAEIDKIDAGLHKVLVNLYTTSTLFKYDESNTKDYINPIIVSNDCAFRTLTKIVAHQYSWLNAAQSVFLNNTKFSELLSMIKNTVNKTILSKSLSDSDEYNTQSIYYRYWIDKAYTLFQGNKLDIENYFKSIIRTLSNFMSNSSSMVGLKIGEWTYNDTINSYEYMYKLRENTINLVNSKTKRKDETLQEYMFAYLNVLYEYRKYFINKRCNKIDGTLWSLRQLEGAIPEVTTKIDDLNFLGENNDESPTASSQAKHKYKVSYYDINNSNYSKTLSIRNGNQLLPDRVMVLFIKVNYVSSYIVKEYLKKCKDGTINLSDQRYIYIPQNGKYAELPFDDTYRLISKEWLDNEAIRVYNSKADTDEQKKLNDNIDESIFPIQWAYKEKMGELITASDKRKVQIRNSLGIAKDFPYVYQEPNGWENRTHVENEAPLIPKIIFDVKGTLDPEKLMELWNSNNYQKAKDVISAKDIICTVGENFDYWCVAIPTSKRPRVIGYQTNLMIKSYRDNDVEISSGDADEPRSLPSGLFGYMLYPITEEQVNSIPGIGTSMSGIQAELKNLYFTSPDSIVDSASDS